MDAVPVLRKTIKAERRKTQKAREWFIMGQIQNALGNTRLSYKAFNRVAAQNPPYELPTHTVFLEAGTPLETCLQRSQLPVNSCHHQGIRRLAKELKPMAIAPDGLTEAVYLPSHPFLWGVQWHPEFCWQRDEASRKIFKAFVDAASRGTEDADGMEDKTIEGA